MFRVIKHIILMSKIMPKYVDENEISIEALYSWRNERLSRSVTFIPHITDFSSLIFIFISKPMSLATGFKYVCIWYVDTFTSAFETRTIMSSISMGSEELFVVRMSYRYKHCKA